MVSHYVLRLALQAVTTRSGPGDEPMKDDDAHGGNDSDDERLDLWSFLRAVNKCSPVAEDAVFGDYAAALATLRTNRISGSSRCCGTRRRTTSDHKAG